MKFLIVPDVHPGKCNSFFFTHSLVNLLQEKGHECIVSAPSAYHFGCLSYDAPIPKKRWFYEPGKSYEEWLFNSGRSLSKYLHNDLASLSTCVQSERPDMILDLGRISASIIARIHHLPFYSFVNRAMYREKPFPKEALADLNSVLSENKLEQILYGRDLFQYANKRICLSPRILQSFDESVSIERYHVPCSTSTTLSHSTVSIYLTQPTYHLKDLYKLFDQTFLGASFPVNIYIPTGKIEHKENLSYTNKPDVTNINENSVVIHDGDEYLFNLAATTGIPQIIISDGSPFAIYQSAIIKRCGFGTIIDEHELTVASLYEAYRRVVANDFYQKRAQFVHNEATKLSALSDLFDEVS